MNFDIGEVPSHAWQITWKHRVLWIIGILRGLFGSIIFPLMFSPILFPVFMQNSKTDVRPLLGVMIGLIIALLLFILVLYPVSVLSQTSITLGVLNANNDNSDNLSATDLIKQIRLFFWRVLGIMLLYTVVYGGHRADKSYHSSHFVVIDNCDIRIGSAMHDAFDFLNVSFTVWLHCSDGTSHEWDYCR